MTRIKLSDVSLGTRLRDSIVAHDGLYEAKQSDIADTLPDHKNNQNFNLKSCNLLMATSRLTRILIFTLIFFV